MPTLGIIQLRQKAVPLNGWISEKNVTTGYGPESQSFADLIPGDYEFSARFYGDWRDNDMSTATAELEVIRHFGTPKETRERHAIRLTEKETKTIATIDS